MTFDLIRLFATYVCLVEIVSTCPQIRSEELKGAEVEAERQEDPNDPSRSYEELADIGNKYVKLKNHELALQFFDKAIEKSLFFKASLFRMRAECHMTLKNWDAAIADYKRIVDLAPDEKTGQVGLRCAKLTKKCLEIVNDSFSFSKLSEDELYKLGLECFEVKATVEASRCFTAAIAKNPKRVPYYVQRGICHSMLRDYGAGESDFREALKINPHDRLARRALSHALLDVGKFEQAVQEMLSFDCNITDLEELGNKLMGTAKRFVEAFRCYSAALERCKINDSIHFAHKRDVCYDAISKQEPDKAISDLQEVLKMESRNMIVRSILTNVLIQSGHPREAIEGAKIRVMSYNLHPYSLWRKGHEKTKSGERSSFHQSVRHSWSEGMERDDIETDSEARADKFFAVVSKGIDINELYNLGLSFIKKEKFKEALICLNEIIERNPSNPHSSLIYSFRGNCHRKLGNWEKAIADFNTGIKLQPQNWVIHVDLCATLIEIGDLKKATEVAEFAIANIPPYNTYEDVIAKIQKLQNIIQQNSNAGEEEPTITPLKRKSDQT